VHPCSLKHLRYTGCVGSNTTPTTVLTVVRRCLVCDFVEQKNERSSEDLIGLPCTRCRAPTERVEVLASRTVPR